MTQLLPEQFTSGGQSGSPDYITYEIDDAGPPRNWRRDTPPPGEDGSTPNVSETVTDA